MRPSTQAKKTLRGRFSGCGWRTGMAGVAVFLCVALVPGHPLHAAQNPFTVSGERLAASNGVLQFSVTITVPAGHYLYADTVSLDSESTEIEPLSVPKSKLKDDPFSGETRAVYESDVRLTYAATGVGAEGLQVLVRYQGCSDTFCFMPAEVPVSFGTAMHAPAEGPADATRIQDANPASHDWQALTARFETAGRASGYLDPDDFRNFLEGSRGDGSSRETDWSGVVEQRGWLLACALILLGGLALNLTPCVLPMIPINLAIIGAGAQASSRGRGLALGAVYGAGMATVYGGLGLLVVLSGARFGALNASPWFNLGIAALFLIMSLAMFDRIHIDLSRFQSRADVSEKRRGRLPAAFVLGGVMALLAGACVAPVVISVLLFATDLYAGGGWYGILLPFLLGIGMALPWPFAGAGLSFLPKPGKWMQAVKYTFGVAILGFALYYGRLGVTLLLDRGPAVRDQVQRVQEESLKAGWLDSLPDAMSRAQAENRPLLIDFWATWCKSCLHMDKTTFKHPEVQAAMEPFVKVKVQAEDLAAPETKAMLDHFGIIGLPTYVVLKPAGDEGSPR